ncbi:MAG: DUF1211 domain-containing protein [Methanomicrobiales archaeon]|nr:DUF1211 domain-containing protein [Methanomicrobiales archaeon]
MKTPDAYQILTSFNAGQNPHRLEAFFDAVYAIAMTILVLGLTLPGDVKNLSPSQTLEVMIPQLFHFALAFFILASFWSVHHRIFVLVTKADSALIRINIGILFITCLLPFTSTLAGDNHTEPFVVVFFHINLLILGLLFLLQWEYIVKSGLSVPIPKPLYNYISLKSLVVPFVSAVAIIVVFFNPSLSSACYILIIVIKLILIPFKPKEITLDYCKEKEAEEISVSVSLNSDADLHALISDVSHEMGISRDELVLKILKRWKQEMRVNIGDEGKLCQIGEDHT